MKPLIKLVAQKVEEISEELNNTFNENDFVRKSDIEITTRIDSENHNIEIIGNHSFSKGLIIFKVYILDTENAPLERRMYIKIDSETNYEYKGIDDDDFIMDPVNEYEIEVAGLEMSEHDRNGAMSDCFLLGEQILIRCNPNLIIQSIDIEYNSCINIEKHTLNEIVYIQDLNTVTENISKLNENITTIDSKLNETINSHNTLLSNCITYDELTRQDIIDFSSKVENNLITLESEDSIDNGILVFRIYLANTQRNFYLKFENNQIIEFKGLTENIEVNGETIKYLANSETFREQFLETPNFENNTAV